MLQSAHANSLSYDEIADIINANAFSESFFYIMPYLLSGEWNFLTKENDRFSSKLNGENLKLPVTNLQKSWLKTLLYDKCMRLFLNKTEIHMLETIFIDIPLLFENDDFHFFDVATDGDDYEDENYIQAFRTILLSIKNNSKIEIEYDSGKGRSLINCYIPLKLNYSSKDDKFRLIAVFVKSEKINKVVLNLSKIKSVTQLSSAYVEDFDKNLVLNKFTSKEPIVLKIAKDRNALERCMLQFASMEKQTEYDELTDSYICKIFYNIQDETELLIRVLSFGPVVKVLGPSRFLKQIRGRIKRQINLNIN